MELREFVAQTLIQISNGVLDAQKELAKTGALVNPAIGGKITPEMVGWAADSGRPVFGIDFDVAVSATEGSGAKGGVGLFIAAIGVGTQASSESGRSSISRIKFRVPFAPPQQA